MTSCVIVEDQPPAQRILKQFIAQTDGLQLAATFAAPSAALEYLRTQPVDLLFLDIHLPTISGIQLLKLLPDPPPVILTTAYEQYALQGYELHVVDYLLKPFSYERFLASIAKLPANKPSVSVKDAAEQQITPDATELFVKSGHAYVRVEVGDILYIAADGDYTELHLPTKRHLSAKTLTEWEEELRVRGFMRVHKSYLVNLRQVERFYSSKLELGEERVVPVGRAYRDQLLERLKG